MSTMTTDKKEKKGKNITPEKGTASAVSVSHQSEAHHPFLQVLKKSWISERIHDMQGMHKYAFSVDLYATKPMIRQEVERKYNVTVRAVHIIRTEGKLKYYRNMPNRRITRKKAIVTLKEGDIIDTQ